MAAAAVAGALSEGQDLVATMIPGQKRGRDDENAVLGDKKWPGWPGDNVFRLMVPMQKVGSIIGRKGEFVKKMCEETRSRIKILDGVPGTSERVVMVSAREEPDAVISPAVDGLLKVHARIIQGSEGEGDGFQTIHTTVAVSSRLLVAATQAGSLIGRQGATIKTIQDASGAIIRVMPIEDLPLCALQDDKVVEIQGDAAKVHKAMELVASHLRKFLVDRSVLPLFELNRAVQSQSQQTVSHASWGNSSTSALTCTTGSGIGGGSHYAPSTFQHDNYYPTSDPLDTYHHGVSMYGRDPGIGGLNPSMAMAPPPAPVITQVTQHMQIPLSYADAIIGSAGANISYMRRTSGATITIEETRGAPGEMTAELHGSATQVQTAQQLIQSFMAGVSTAPSSTYNSVDGAYGSYNPQTLFYSSTTGTAGNSTGAYGSPYGSNYAY